MFRTLRTLLKEVKEYKRASIATPVYMILEVAMEMVIPFLMAVISMLPVTRFLSGWILLLFLRDLRLRCSDILVLGLPTVTGQTACTWLLTASLEWGMEP